MYFVVCVCVFVHVLALVFSVCTRLFRKEICVYGGRGLVMNISSLYSDDLDDDD